MTTDNRTKDKKVSRCFTRVADCVNYTGAFEGGFERDGRDYKSRTSAAFSLRFPHKTRKISNELSAFGTLNGHLTRDPKSLLDIIL